jgi:Uma2 family endonuclease
MRNEGYKLGAAAELLLTTVEEYRQLPTREDVIQELHWGRVIVLTRPKMKHSKVQYRLVELLRPLAAGHGIAASEVPFRALPEYDLRGADVAYVSSARWDATADDDNLSGSPELVIEVLSPSNTKEEMREKAALYLSTGCQEFWVVDAKRKTVTVARRGGESSVYQIGDAVQLTVIGGEIAVAQIFT